jgi:hypothetical protein
MRHRKERYATDLEHRKRMRAAYDRAYRQANKARLNAQKRQRRALGPKPTAAVNRKNRLRRYGLSVQDYDNMSARQNGSCAICRKKSDGRLCIDHSHVTRKLRDLLCRRCNGGLGFYDDDPILVRAAADYLDRWRLAHEGPGPIITDSTVSNRRSGRRRRDIPLRIDPRPQGQPNAQGDPAGAALPAQRPRRAGRGQAVAGRAQPRRKGRAGRRSRTSSTASTAKPRRATTETNDRRAQVSASWKTPK